jgi:hypothetical protein
MRINDELSDKLLQTEDLRSYSRAPSNTLPIDGAVEH